MERRDRTLTVTADSTIIADPGPDQPTINVSGSGVDLLFDPADGNLDVHLEALHVSNGAKVTVASLGANRSEANHRVLVIESDALTIDNAWLDLTDNDLILDYDGPPSEATAAAVRDLLAGGYNYGQWDGHGIVSSLADYSVTLATAGNDQLEGLFMGFGDGDSGSLFAGQVVDTSTVLVKFTFIADIDLNGSNDFQDLSAFNGNYDAGATNDNAYVEGDVTYDGLLDFQDLSIFNGGYDPDNVPAEAAPVLGLDGPSTVEVEVGQPITVTGTYMDVNGQTVTLGVNGNVGTITKETGTSSGKWTWTHLPINTPAGNIPVTLGADDAVKPKTERTISLTVRPLPPDGLTAIPRFGHFDIVDLSWSEDTTPGVTYAVHVSTTEDFEPSDATRVAGGIDENSYSIDSLDGATHYFFAVVKTVPSSGGGGVSSKPARTTATTPPQPDMGQDFPFGEFGWAGWMSDPGDGYPGVSVSWSPREPRSNLSPWAVGETATATVTGLPEHTWVDVRLGTDPPPTWAEPVVFETEGTGVFQHGGSSVTASITLDSTAQDFGGWVWGSVNVKFWTPSVSILALGNVEEGNDAVFRVDYEPIEDLPPETPPPSISYTTSTGVTGVVPQDGIIRIPTDDDLVVEPDRALKVTLNESGGYRADSHSNRSATVMVYDNEPRISLAASDGSEAPPAGQQTGTSPITVRVGLSRPPTRDFPVDLSVRGTAVAGEDYTPLSVPLVIPAGYGEGQEDIEFVAEVPVLPDSKPEWSESVELALNPSTRYRLAVDSYGNVTPQGPFTKYIVDNDHNLVLGGVAEDVETNPGFFGGAGDLIPLNVWAPTHETGTEVKLSASEANAVEVFNTPEGTGMPIIGGSDTSEVVKGAGVDPLALFVRALKTGITSLQLQTKDAATKSAQTNSSDSAKLTVLGDLDVDSDNDSVLQRSAAEDQIEAAGPGKYVALFDERAPMVLALHAVDLTNSSLRIDYSPEKFKVWSSSGALLEAGVPYPAAQFGFANGETALRVQALGATTPGGAVISAALDLDGGSASFVTFDTVAVTGVRFDLDIDSENANGLERSALEEEIEDDPAKHGKHVVVGGPRVPLKIETRGTLDASAPVAQVRLTFPASVKVYKSGGGAIESGVGYSYSQLGMLNGTTAELEVEAVSGSVAFGDARISAQLDLDGSGLSVSWGASDAVRATALELDLDVLTISHNVAGASLAETDEENAGAFVPLNDDDDDYDGANLPDVTQVGPVAGENDLLPIVLRRLKPNASAAAGNYTLTIPAHVRVWQSSDRSGAVTGATAFADNAETTLYVEGISQGSDAIKMNWTDGGQTANDVDRVRVNVFQWDGPLNVPGDAIYSYTFSAPPGVSLSSWGAPVGGTMSASNPSEIHVLWDNTPRVGQVVYNVTSDYVWDLHVNVVQVTIGASSLAYSASAAQHAIESNRIVSSTAGAAVTSTLVVNNIEGPVVGGTMRGIKFLEMGFVQNVRFTEKNTVYNDSIRQSTLQSNQYHLDYVTSPVRSASPWYDSTAAATFFSPAADPAAPIVGRAFAISDTPSLTATDKVDQTTTPWTLENCFFDPPSRFNLRFDARLYFAVRTKEAATGADARYFQKAQADWQFFGSGTIAGNVWTPLVANPMSGDANFSDPASRGNVVPIVTGSPANDVLKNQAWE